MREQERVNLAPEVAPEVEPEPSPQAQTRFTRGGTLPPVAEVTAPLRAASASDRAFGAVEAPIPTAVIGEAGRAVGRALRQVEGRGADAVEISHTVHDVAFRELTRLAPESTPQARADAAMALATYVLVGRDQIAKLQPVDAGRTSLVEDMRQAASQDRRDMYWWPTDHTRSGGALEPRFADGTDGQAFHINFFLAAGYVARGSMVNTAGVMAGALYHETLDPSIKRHGGGSHADYVSSVFAARAGARIAALRDRGDGDLIATVVAGFMARGGTEIPCPPERSAERHAIALAEIAALHEERNSLVARLAVDYNPGANALLGATQAFHHLRGAPGR